MKRGKPIGCDFVEQEVTRTAYCSECGMKIPAGAIALVSIGLNGKVAKRVCSEECRLEFDNAFWQEVARKRDLGIKDRRP
jgi:hypothetical protein